MFIYKCPNVEGHVQNGMIIVFQLLFTLPLYEVQLKMEVILKGKYTSGFWNRLIVLKAVDTIGNYLKQIISIKPYLVISNEERLIV